MPYAISKHYLTLKETGQKKITSDLSTAPSIPKNALAFSLLVHFSFRYIL